MAKLYDVNDNLLAIGPLSRMQDAMKLKPLSYIKYDNDEIEQWEENNRKEKQNDTD